MAPDDMAVRPDSANPVAAVTLPVEVIVGDDVHSHGNGSFLVLRRDTVKSAYFITSCFKASLTLTIHHHDHH